MQTIFFQTSTKFFYQKSNRFFFRFVIFTDYLPRDIPFFFLFRVFINSGRGDIETRLQFTARGLFNWRKFPKRCWKEKFGGNGHGGIDLIEV